MATFWLEEYRGIGDVSGDAQVQAPKGSLRLQEISFTTTAGISAFLLDETTLIAFVSDTSAYWRLGFALSDLPIVPIGSPPMALNQGVVLAGVMRPLVVPRGHGTETRRYLSMKAW